MSWRKVVGAELDALSCLALVQILGWIVRGNTASDRPGELEWSRLGVYWLT